MTLVDPGSRLVDHDQPTITAGLWIWPGPEGKKKKAVVGNFANSYCVVEDYEGSADSGASTDNSVIESLNKDLLLNGVQRGKEHKEVAIYTVLALGMAIFYCLV